MAKRKTAAKKASTAVAARKPLTPEESQRELEEFLDLVVRGHGEEDLRRAAAEELRTPIDELFAAAAKKFRTAGQADPDVVRGFCIEAYRELYRVALSYAEFSVALKCLAHLERASRS
jgi:hypothetical protein